jgi:hypothetical protein
MTCQTSFADESTRAKHPDDPFLSLFRQHDEFDMALLDIEDRVAFGALPEDVGLGFEDRDGSASADRRQKCFGVEDLG